MTRYTRNKSSLPIAAGLLVASLLAGCTGAAPPPAGSPATSLTPVAATASPMSAPSTTGGGAIVTFRAADGSVWKMRLTRETDIAIARDHLAGKPGLAIPNGRIVRDGPDVNVGWSWHLDPLDFEWADMTMEVCDGLPQHVEDGTLTSDRFCPWSATVIAVDPAP